MAENKDIIAKVQKLLALATSDNVHEASAAAAQAQRLIDKHQIDSALLDCAQGEDSGPEDVEIIQDTIFKFPGPRVTTWVLNLACGIAEHNGCRPWYSSGHRQSRGRVYAAGTREDLDLTQTLIVWVKGQIERLLKPALRTARDEADYWDRGCGKEYANSFKLGAVSKVLKRLREERERTQAEMRDPQLAYQRALEDGDTARLLELDSQPKYELAVINSALARVERKGQLAETWVESNVEGLYSVARTGASSGKGWSDGRKAGSKVGLSGPKGFIG